MTQLRACVAVNGALLLVVLCGSAPLVHAQGNAARLTAPPGKALVVIYRTDRQPIATPVPVTVNAKEFGGLANGRFLAVTVEPGRAFVRTGDRVVTTLRLDVEANRSYFVRVDVVHGVNTLQTDLRPVSEAEGRRALAQGGVPPPSPPVAGVPPPRPAAQPQAIAPAPPRPAVQPLVAAPPPAPPRVAPVAKPKPKPKREEEEYGLGHDWKVVFIPKLGTFKLANASQVVGTTPSTFDTSSKSVISIEAEWRNKSGLALGGEIFSYKNQLQGTFTGIPISAQQQLLVATINGKYYFSTGTGLHPFAGAGIGFSNATYSGDLSGSSSGLALQGLAGVEYRFDSFGLYLEYKYLASTVGKSEKVKVGGSGILAGVSFIF